MDSVTIAPSPSLCVEYTNDASEACQDPMINRGYFLAPRKSILHWGGV